MPTFRHGKKTAVLLNGTDMSPFLNEATTTTEIETAETTAFSDDDKTYIVGLSDGTISTSGMFDSTAGASDEVLRGLIANDDNTFTVLPEGGGLGGLDLCRRRGLVEERAHVRPVEEHGGFLAVAEGRH